MAPERISRFLFYLVLLAVSFLVFLPAVRGGFIWDDRDTISENPFIQSSRFIREFMVSPFNGPSGIDQSQVNWISSPLYYRPLTMFSYWLDWQVWHRNSAGFHLTNLLLHLVNVCLVLAVVFLACGDAWLGFISALLFSLFPLHFENVAWISGRTDLLSFMFLGLAALFFIRFRRSQRYSACILSALFFMLSLFSKENGLLLFFTGLVFLLGEKESAKNILRTALPFIGAMAIWLLMRFLAVGFPVVQPSGISLRGVAAALGFYAWKTIYPFQLPVTIDSHPVLSNPVYAGLGLLVLAATLILLFLFVKRRKRYSPAFLFLSAYIFSLLPAMVIIFSVAVVSDMAWRFLYSPSLFFLIGIVYALRKLKNRGRWKYAGMAAALVVAVFYIVTILPFNRLYGQSESSFWLGIKNAERESPLARLNIAGSLLLRHPQRALELYDTILRRRDDPRHLFLAATVYENIASYYAGKGDLVSAKVNFEKLQSLGPKLPLSAELKYAYFLGISGERKEAKNRMERILAVYPRHHQVLLYGAALFHRLGDMARARELLQQDFKLFGLAATREMIQKLEAGTRR